MDVKLPRILINRVLTRDLKRYLDCEKIYHLEGETMYDLLTSSINLSATAQGRKYWVARARGDKPMSSDDLVYLRCILFGKIMRFHGNMTISGKAIEHIRKINRPPDSHLVQ